MKTPPGFGQGKQSLIFVIEYNFKGPQHAELQECSVIVQRGMPVHEKLTDFYWKEVASYGAMLDVLKKHDTKPDQYLLIDDSGIIRGGGHCASANVTAHDLAWLSCFFAEVTSWQMSLPVPDGIHPSEFANVPGIRFRGLESKESNHADH